MSTKSKEYATSTAGAFQFLADFLDASDELIEFCAHNHQGKEHFSLGDGIQRDLRSLAEWLKEHPEVDAQLLEAMPYFLEWTNPGSIGHST